MILINYSDRRPIYEQMVDGVKELILKGVLEVDSQLPSVRSLAMELSVNPNTIQRAYTELERQGIIYCVKGRGNYVAPRERLLAAKEAELLTTLEHTAHEAYVAGLSRERLISTITQVYEKEASAQ